MNFLELLIPFVRRSRQLRELGADIRRTGRDMFLLVDGDRQIEIYAELQAIGKVDYAVDATTGALRWKPPHESEPIGDAKRTEILAVFVRYMQILGRRVEVIEDAGCEGRTYDLDQVRRSDGTV